MNYTKILNPILVLVIGLSLSVTSFGGLAQEFVPNTQVPSRPNLGTIKGKVFTDANGNGIDDDAANIDYTGIFLNVLRFPGTTYGQFQLQSGGNFEFAVLPDADYKLEFSFPGGQTPTIKGSLDNPNDSDINPDGKTDYILITEAKREATVKAGLLLNKNAILGDYIWKDSNRNGAQDQDEKGLTDVEVTAYKSGTMDIVSKTKSNDVGYYSLNIPAGKYDFRFVAPIRGYSPTIKNNAFNNNDSNIDTMGMIKNLGLFAGEINNDYDAGFVYDELLPPPTEEVKPEPKPTFQSTVTSFFDKYIEAIKKGIPMDIKSALDSLLGLLRTRFGR